MEIRFGILGCGAIAAHHAQAIAMVPGAVLAGAADARPESARTFCEKYGGQAFESMEAMLASPAVDAVCVLTPSGLHAQQPSAADAGQACAGGKTRSAKFAGRRPHHRCRGAQPCLHWRGFAVPVRGFYFAPEGRSGSGPAGADRNGGRFDEILPKPGIFRLQLLAGYLGHGWRRARS